MPTASKRLQNFFVETPKNVSKISLKVQNIDETAAAQVKNSNRVVPWINSTPRW